MSKDYKKLHEEALERAKIFKSPYCQHAAEVIFPELRESEDERIREAIIDTLNRVDQRIIETNYGIKHKDAVAWLEKQKEPELSEDLGEYITELSKQFPEVSFAKLSRIAVRVKNWLEKQGEQNPSWSEEDEKMCSQVINEIEAIKSNSSTIFEKNIAQDKIDWLESIKDRVQPQLKQEWSEEDEENRINAIKYLEIFDAQAIHGDVAIPCINWLKSLKFKPNHWKPSEEQMEALNWIAYNYALMDKGTEEKLQSLYNGLLKL